MDTNELLSMMTGLFMVFVMCILMLQARHEDELAKAGLQQCKVDGSVLWQKECGK